MRPQIEGEIELALQAMLCRVCGLGGDILRVAELLHQVLT